MEPAEPLASGTRYTLYVAPDLLAKNGGSTLAMTTNNQGLRINFRTAVKQFKCPTGCQRKNTAAAAAAGRHPAPNAGHG